jgi:hypothetical protein
MTTVALRAIASARAGDKGDVLNVSVWTYHPRHYAAVKRELTAARVKAAYPALFRGAVERYDLDQLCGLNFVMRDALEGGVNGSLGLDGHGKSFSFLLLDLPINLDAPEEDDEIINE